MGRYSPSSEGLPVKSEGRPVKSKGRPVKPEGRSARVCPSVDPWVHGSVSLLDRGPVRVNLAGKALKTLYSAFALAALTQLISFIYLFKNSDASLFGSNLLVT